MFVDPQTEKQAGKAAVPVPGQGSMEENKRCGRYRTFKLGGVFLLLTSR